MEGERAITVTLRLFHELKELAGRKTVRLRPPSRDIKSVLDWFVKSCPGAGEELLDEDGTLSTLYLVIVNGQILKRSQWDEVQLSEGDEIAIMSLISGG
jgi:thiamine biosynthesis protein ThiS